MRRALGHENDLDIANRDGHDMDDVTWHATADTTVAHAGVAMRSGGEIPPPGLVADSLQQKVSNATPLLFSCGTECEYL